MRLAKSFLFFVLTLLMTSLVVSAQTTNRRSEDDPRNYAPTVGTGGPVGGPTGLFTVYDGTTLRRGEYTFSIAYSNFDRDPGDVDIVEVPISFQVGVNNYLELFFNTDAYRAIKVNSRRNLSGFYLPNVTEQFGTIRQTLPAIVLAPRGAGATQFPGAVFRPQGVQPFVGYPFTGGPAGNLGLATAFGFPAGTPIVLGTPRGGDNGSASQFPGVGSPAGSILPGVVLQTSTIVVGGTTTAVPTFFTNAPSYLPDAPFLSRSYGESAFNTFTVGGKIRFTGPNNPVGIALVPFYRYYADDANSVGGFNQLQRGASPGARRGDFGLVAAADGRLTKYLNLSGNIGYIYNSSVKADFPGADDVTLLDRPDELLAAIGVDLPVNKYFQLIGEGRALKYVGGRTPNAFENDPIDLLGGVRIFPQRWFGMSFWYRYHANQQDNDIFDDEVFRNNITVPAGATGTTSFTSTGSIPGFRTSTDPHGFGAQFFIGRRNPRGPAVKPNQYPTINSVTISDTEITLGCPEGQQSTSGACNDSRSVSVATNATDPDGDTLLYQYTVSGGQITGTGANVTWDLTGVQPGTYTISVAVDDGCGVCGQPRQETVRVVACPDCVTPPPPCPVVSASVSPSEIQEGQTATFTADVTLNGANPTYNWTVSAGTIESGQGTPSIVVRATPGTAGGSITATVELGSVDPSCQRTASATVSVVTPPKPPTTLVDRYGVEKANTSKQRLDEFARQLQADPGARGFIIAYGGAGRRGGNAEADRRIRFAVDYLVNNRQIDRGRLVTVNGGTAPSGAATELYLVPTGADEPTPNPQE
jgi:hypothetical protein